MIDSENPFRDPAVEETIVSRFVKFFRSWFHPRKLMIALFVVVYGAGNLFVPSILCLISNSDPLQVILGLFCIGGLATEIGLLAAGVALTRGSLVENFTVNSLLMVFMYASYVVGLQIASSWTMPQEIALLFFAIIFGGFVLTTGCLLAVRWFSKIQFDVKTESKLEPIQSVTERNFSIRYIMLSTAAVAIAICVIGWSIPKTTEMGPPPPFFKILTVCTIYAIESIIALILCVHLVLHRSFWIQIGSLVILTLFCILFPYLNAIIVQFLTRDLLYEFLPWAYAYITGLVFFACLTLAPLRLVGYRVTRRVLA
jgi:hypothetical protein